MNRFTINAEDFIQLPEIIKRIRYCLRNQIGFSLVRVGDAENEVMAQGTIYPDAKVKSLWWASDENWTGVTLPNYAARDKLVASVKQADVVGVLHQDAEYIWKPLTEEIFNRYGIKPKQICYAFINIYFADYPEIIEIMRNYKVLLIGKQAAQFAEILKEKYAISVAGILNISHIDQLPHVLAETEKIDYDLALISAGSNAVILAAALAQQNKVAIDFGRGMNPEFWVKQ